MSEPTPEKCPRCGSQFRALLPGVGIQFGCATIVLPVGGYAKGLPCVMRQRDQLAAIESAYAECAEQREHDLRRRLESMTNNTTP